MQLHYLDTIAWVLADNGRVQQALAVFEERVLPVLSGVDHHPHYHESYAALQKRAK